MKIRIFLLFLLYFLVGCASFNTDVEITANEIRTNKDAAYDKKLDRILIAYSVDPSIFKGQKVVGFSDRLRKRGVYVKEVALTKNPLDLDPGREMRTYIALVKPNQVMELAIVHATKMGGYYSSFDLQGTIYDKSTNRQVWQFNYYGKGQIPFDKLVDAVINKLDSEDLLPPPKP